MSNKLQSTIDSTFALPDSIVLTLSGRDSVPFAQAQFMSDVAALADGAWHWSGWLTPKGRVVALFAVLRHSAERLDLLLLDGDADALASSLKRYVFRSKVSIDVRADIEVAGRFETPAHAAAAAIGHTEEGFIELDMGSAVHARTLVLLPSASVAADPAAHLRWRTLDMAHGLPRLPEDQREHWTPQQLSLDRLQAYSVRKGCYPGQEIVARTHFLGQAKRGLVALQDAPDAHAGDDVSAAGQALGRVACVGDGLLLAVLPLERADTSLRVGERDVVAIPLLDGLAR